MANLTVKNIPEPLYLRLKEAAKQHHRSLNSELIACLEKNLLSSRIDVQAHIAAARALRAQVDAKQVSLREIEEFKSQGRK
jgi:plasmid stability protein